MSSFAKPHVGCHFRGETHQQTAKGASGRGGFENLCRTLKSTQIRGVPKSDFCGSQKRGDEGGGEDGEKWWESEQGPKGERGGNEGKRVGGKGPESALEKL